ncbi:POXA3b laccase small subunit [Mycena amicta]|nr:POXA3b laccase small subunit [Mycena amicta]
MLVLRSVFALALVTLTCASKLSARQATNTNAQISPIIDAIDEAMHKVGPTVLTLQANHTLSQTTLAPQFTTMENAFTTADTKLAAVPVSSGSTTVSPTNDEIGVVLADAVALVATTLSGIVATGAVPGFATMVQTLDPIIAKTLNQYNVTLPGGTVLVGIMMRDARQFLVAEGFTQTNTALGF